MTAAYLYNHAVKKLTNKEVNFTGLKVMLVNGYTFAATHMSISSASANEVSGNGWPVGGAPLPNVNVAIQTTNDARLDADNVNVTATPGDIGPATGAIIYDDVSVGDDVLMYIDFEVAVTAAAGTPFSFFWNSNGIIQFVYT